MCIIYCGWYVVLCGMVCVCRVSCVFLQVVYDGCRVVCGVCRMMWYGLCMLCCEWGRVWGVLLCMWHVVYVEVGMSCVVYRVVECVMYVTWCSVYRMVYVVCGVVCGDSRMMYVSGVLRVDMRCKLCSVWYVAYVVCGVV